MPFSFSFRKTAGVAPVVAQRGPAASGAAQASRAVAMNPAEAGPRRVEIPSISEAIGILRTSSSSGKTNEVFLKDLQMVVQALMAATSGSVHDTQALFELSDWLEAEGERRQATMSDGERNQFNRALNRALTQLGMRPGVAPQRPAGGGILQRMAKPVLTNGVMPFLEPHEIVDLSQASKALWDGLHNEHPVQVAQRRLRYEDQWAEAQRQLLPEHHGDESDRSNGHVWHQIKPDLLGRAHFALQELLPQWLEAVNSGREEDLPFACRQLIRLETMFRSWEPGKEWTSAETQWVLDVIVQVAPHAHPFFLDGAVPLKAGPRATWFDRHALAALQSALMTASPMFPGVTIVRSRSAPPEGTKTDVYWNFHSPGDDDGQTSYHEAGEPYIVSKRTTRADGRLIIYVHEFNAVVTDLSQVD